LLLPEWLNLAKHTRAVYALLRPERYFLIRF